MVGIKTSYGAEHDRMKTLSAACAVIWQPLWRDRGDVPVPVCVRQLELSFRALLTEGAERLERLELRRIGYPHLVFEVLE
jgi:hypothetical protein